MDRSEFDRFATEYLALHERNIAASGESPDYFADYKMRDLARLMADAGANVQAPRVLDFGAGVGNSVPYVRRHLPGAALACVDVSMQSLAIARQRFGDDAGYCAFDGSRLPFRDATFDGAFAACVFHHIPHGEHRSALTEIRRVLKPGGTLMVYEHNPFNPLTRRAVDACPFDENAVLVRAQRMRATLRGAGFAQATIRYRVFFPRALAWMRPLESWLTWLPLGAQYYVAARP